MVPLPFMYITQHRSGWPVPIGRKRVPTEELEKMLTAENNGVPNSFTETFRKSVYSNQKEDHRLNQHGASMTQCLGTGNSSVVTTADWKKCCSTMYVRETVPTVVRVPEYAREHT